MESLRIYSNCRVSRIYFNDEELLEESIPADYKLFFRIEPYVPIFLFRLHDPTSPKSPPRFDPAFEITPTHSFPTPSNQ